MLFDQSKCKKCEHINPVYKNICEECKSFLREKVANIDLWDTIREIIEEPTAAFQQIIFSEHKNFILFITFIIAIKNLIISRFISVPQLGSNGVTTSFILSLTLVLVLTIILFFLITSIQLKLYFMKGIQLRFRDIYAVNSYVFIPYLFGLFFIFPVEIIVLGGNIFSNNPYSFQIKSTITYILMGIEFIVAIWSFILFYKSILVVGLNRFLSFNLTFLFFLLWLITLYISSKIIFTI